jgi:aspartate racemase
MDDAVVGVLGGMGPAATVDFFAKLVAGTPASRDQDHLPVLVHSVPQIPDRSDSFLHGAPSPEPMLVAFAKRLQASGAAVIVIPCNTAHLWHQAVASAVQVPVLHIVDPVIEALKHFMGDRIALRVGLLGTTATVESGLYPSRCESQGVTGLQWMVPTPDEQRDFVARGIHAVKAGDADQGRVLLRAAACALVARGAQAVVQACTEIPLVLGHEALPVPAFDATQLLADATVAWALRHRLSATERSRLEAGACSPAGQPARH